MSVLTRNEEHILLAVHFLNENAYLITIREQIKQFTGKYYSVGTIYAPLNRLFLNGYLNAEQKKVSDGNSTKPIKFYSVAKKGYEALEEAKKIHNQAWQNFANPIRGASLK